MSSVASSSRLRCALLGLLLVLVAACGDEVSNSTATAPGGNPGLPNGSDLTVTVAAVKDGGTIHSGFLVGSAFGPNRVVDFVEVSLDSRPFALASLVSSTDWSFKLPTGAATWRDGTLHTVAVRAVDFEGGLSPVTTLTVRKGVNKDVNGDGQIDLAVGATNNRAVYLFLGSTVGIPSRSATAADAILTGTPSLAFGIFVALGDVNGDGFADVAVVALPGGNGEVDVFHGSAAGIASGDQTTAATTITSAVPGFFGNVALGDANGDGFADLAVGTGGASTVYVFHGSTTGIAGGLATTANHTLTGAPGDQFGKTVLIEDLNGDGVGDLVVGAAGSTVNGGAAYVFNGVSVFGVPNGTIASAATTLTGPATSFFGSSLAVGDVNGDGIKDLAIGEIGIGGGGGSAYVFHGSGAGIASAASTAANTTITAPGGDAFGASVAMGDVNGDGFTDLSVTDTGFSSGAGAAYVFRGSAAGIPSGDSTAAATTLVGTDIFGSSIASADLNGDGIGELIVGSIGSKTVHVFKGSGLGIPSGGSSSADSIIIGAGTFGSSLGL